MRSLSSRRGGAPLAAVVISIVVGLPAVATAEEPDTGRVRVHLSDGDEATRAELFLERAGAIQATCAGACDVDVPVGAYRLRVLRGDAQFVQPITIDRPADVRWSRGARWRPWVGVPLAILSGMVFVGDLSARLSPSPNESASARSASWFLLPTAALLTAGGLWLTFSRDARAHVDVEPRAQATVAIHVVPVPIAGGASLQIGGAF